MTASWGLFLCNCRGALPLDLQKLVLPVAPAILSVASEPVADFGEFAAAVERQAPDDILIACCAPADLFTRLLKASHPQAPRLHFVDLKELCFSVHPETHEAHTKATRLLRLAVAATENPTPAYQPLAVGRRLLIAGGAVKARKLADALGASAEPIFVIPADERAAAEAEELSGFHSGKVVEVRGHLGAFAVTIEEYRGSTSARREFKADQVVVMADDGSFVCRARTGCHLLGSPGGVDLPAVGERVRALQGEFLKPVQVDYHPEVCAGGTAGEESCGLCIAACPYDAIARDPKNHLRVRVEQMACEACGACVSACPTSSLRFTEPSADEHYARMAALLRPVAGRDPAEAVTLLFHCGEKGRRTLAAAGRAKLSYPSSVLPLEVPCLRFVSEAHMLEAFALGAAAVALLGCESCPHGERELLHQKIDFCRLVLDAFTLGGERLRLVTASDGLEDEAVAALRAFTGSLAATPIHWENNPRRQNSNRDVIGDALGTFMTQLGREPGRRPLASFHPFAFAEVEASGCTLCRSCVNLCPVHAFKFEDASHSLQFKHIACVACGLCEKACPEHVIALKREIVFERDALEYRTVATDDMVACANCGKPYINRRALEIIESRVFSLDSLLDTFSGERRSLLRMCPDCRTVAAMLEVDKGWKP